ncbi:MAG: PQQ-binding-like beta-propeller repeat protein [Planctomycetia bacterium]|nr:PQQ-binding-like beta-propeller repeat protein [Planctomycetia bacterium]
MIDVLFLLAVVTIVPGLAWFVSCLPGTRAAERDLVWRTALIGLAAAPLLVLLQQIVGIWGWSLPIESAGAPPVGAAGNYAFSTTAADLSGDTLNHDERSLPDEFAAGPAEAREESHNRDVWRAATSPGRPADDHSRVRSTGSTWFTVLSSARAWLAAVWIAGSLFCLARLGWGLWQMRRLVRGAEPVADEFTLSIGAWATQKVGIRSAVRLAISDGTYGPVVAGVFWPAILLPPALLRPEARSDLKIAMLHECGHIRRRDAAFNLLQQLVVATYWFHPLVYMMDRSLRQLREELCDNYVLAEEPAVNYAESLLGVALQMRQSAVAIAAVGMYGSQINLERRVESFLNPCRTIATRASGRARVLVQSAAICIAFAILMIRIDGGTTGDSSLAAASALQPSPATTQAVVAVPPKAANSTATPLDALDRARIPPAELLAAGPQPPPQLVAVIGDGRLSHWGWILKVAMTPDGRRLVTAGRDGTARIWDAATGKELHCLTDLDSINGIAISPNGKVLATAAGLVRSPQMTAQLTLWDLEAGVVQRTNQGTHFRSSVAFSPDGTRIAAAGMGMAHIWDTATGQELLKIQAHAEGRHILYSIPDTAFSPDGQVLLTSGFGPAAPGNRRGETVKFWNVHSGELLDQLDGRVSPNPFLKDGTLVVRRGDGAILHWDPKNKREIRRFSEPRENVGIPQFSPDETVVAVTSTEYQHQAMTSRHTLEVWDLASGAKRCANDGLPADVNSLAFTPDSSTIITGGGDGRLRFWNARSGKSTQSGDDKFDIVASVTFSPDERTVVLSKRDGTIDFWDVESRKTVASIHSEREWPRAVAFSPDGATLAAGGNGRIVDFWDVSTKRRRRSLEVAQGNAIVFRLSADGNLIATGASEGQTVLYDLKREKSVATITSPGNDGHLVRFLAFDSDGKLLASACRNTVTLHDIVTGQNRQIGIPGHIHAMDMSSDGKLLACGIDAPLPGGGSAPRIVVCSLSNADEPAILEGHKGSELYSVAFNPSGSRFASAGNDGAVRIWDPLQGVVLDTITLSPQAGQIRKVVYSPSGRHLATINANGTVYLLCLADAPAR